MTAICIQLGDPVLLELYKSLEDKKFLLDRAIKRNDGNAILAITLFMRNTLKRGLFCCSCLSRFLRTMLCSYLLLCIVLVITLNHILELFSKELMSRPTAVDHYCSYLRGTAEIEELHEILTILGRTEEAAMLKYRHCLRCAKSAEVRKTSLEDCVK